MKTTLKIFLTLGLMFVQVTISFFGADALAQRRQLRYREGVPMDSAPHPQQVLHIRFGTEDPAGHPETGDLLRRIDG